MRTPKRKNKKPALYVRADGELSHSSDPVDPAQLISTIALLKEENKTLQKTNKEQSLVIQQLEECMLIDTLSTLVDDLKERDTTIEQQRFAIRAYTQKVEEWNVKVCTLEKENNALKKRLEFFSKGKNSKG